MSEEVLDKSKMRSIVIQMALPAIMESFFVSFAGLVDSYMVSTMGSVAVAAVGLTSQPIFIGLALYFALNTAIAALTARRFGEKNQRSANEIAVTSIVFILITSVVISTVFVIMAPTFMTWCGSGADTHEMAVTYFRVRMAGLIFNALLMCFNSIQRGCGNTRITMRTNMISNGLNIVFNYLLINGHLGFPAWGVFGAAVATVLGTIVGSIVSFMSICLPDGFVSVQYFIRNKVRATWQAMKNIIQIGYGVFLEQLLMRIGFLLTALMAADQGTDAFAAHQVGMNLLGLSFSFGDGLQVTAIALIGRSLGQGRKDLAQGYASIVRTFGFIIAVVLAVVYFAGGRFLFGLFFKEPHIVEIGVSISRVIMFILFFQISQVILFGTLRAAGDTLFTAFASLISVTLIRTAGSYICGYILAWGIVGIWMGVLADQMSRLILSYFRFKQGKWLNIKI